MKVARGWIHTVPRNGHWGHRVEGQSDFLPEVYPTKEEAETAGRSLAIIAKTEHVVHNRDGVVAHQISYRHDANASTV